MNYLKIATFVCAVLITESALAATPATSPNLPPTPAPTKAPQCDCSEDKYTTKDGECFKAVCDLKVKCEPNKKDASSGTLGKPEKIECTEMPPVVSPPGGSDGGGKNEGGTKPPNKGGGPIPNPSPAQCPSENEGGDGGDVGECNDGETDSMYFLSGGVCFESTITCEGGCWFYEASEETTQVVPLNYCFADDDNDGSDPDSDDDGSNEDGSNGHDKDTGNSGGAKDSPGDEDDDDEEETNEDQPADPVDNNEGDSGSSGGVGNTPGGGSTGGGTTNPPTTPPDVDQCPSEDEGGIGGKWPQCEEGDVTPVGPPYPDPSDPGSCYQTIMYCSGECWSNDGGAIPVDSSLCGDPDGGGEL